MNIVELDPTSERDLDDAAAITTAYWREVLGDDEPDTTAASIVRRAHLSRDDIDGPFLLVEDGDVRVGLSHLEVLRGFGNEHMAWLDDLYVLPASRRRGFGRALLDANVELARAADRTVVAGAFAEGDADGEAFASALGLRLANRERQSRAPVGGLDRALLQGWNHAPDGYTLVQFEGPSPDELLDDYVRIQSVMNDAPRSESFGDFNHTAAHRRAAEAEWAADGTEYWFAGARHDETGELAGYTELLHHPDTPWLVEQEDTAVAPAHRGKRIGRWLKAVNALRVLDEKPDARFLETWNDGTNRWMLDINVAMGFAPVAVWVEGEIEI